MHIEAKDFVTQWASSDPNLAVVELGSRNTSGDRIRDLFIGTAYIGVDAVDGDDVDVVANAATWRPDELVDLVLCCELFEHTPYWPDIIENAFNIVKPGGRVVFTCAGPGRAIHGVNHDDPDQPGYYGNVSADRLRLVMHGAGFTDVDVAEVPHRSTFLGGTDTQATGIRPL